jgi:hypothetical protein
MREATISLAILLTVFGIYVYVNRDTSSAPTSAIAPAPIQQLPVTTQGATNDPGKSVRKSFRKSSQGASVAQERARSEEDSGPSFELETSEALPSVYSRADQSPPADAAVSAEPGVKKANKNLHGIPVTAWLESRQNFLPTAPVSAEASDRLHLYVQCMEMKSDGSRPLTERDCRALTARQGTDEAPRRNGLPSSVY